MVIKNLSILLVMFGTLFTLFSKNNQLSGCWSETQQRRRVGRQANTEVENFKGKRTKLRFAKLGPEGFL